MIVYGQDGVVDELRPVEHGPLVLSGGGGGVMDVPAYYLDDDGEECLLTDLTLRELEELRAKTRQQIADALLEAIAAPHGPRLARAKDTMEALEYLMTHEIEPLLEACYESGEEPGVFVGHRRLGR